jgi:hypothetical protein
MAIDIDWELRLYTTLAVGEAKNADPAPEAPTTAARQLSTGRLVECVVGAGAAQGVFSCVAGHSGDPKKLEAAVSAHVGGLLAQDPAAATDLYCLAIACLGLFSRINVTGPALYHLTEEKQLVTALGLAPDAEAAVLATLQTNGELFADTAVHFPVLLLVARAVLLGAPSSSHSSFYSSSAAASGLASWAPRVWPEGGFIPVFGPHWALRAVRTHQTFLSGHSASLRASCSNCIASMLLLDSARFDDVAQCADPLASNVLKQREEDASVALLEKNALIAAVYAAECSDEVRVALALSYVESGYACAYYWDYARFYSYLERGKLCVGYAIRTTGE